jgi:hypothetical protein
MKKAFISALVILTIGLNSVFAQYERCVMRGWISDNDPKGTNIRDAPSIKGKIIDVFEPGDEDTGEPTVEIVGYQSGWLKIRLLKGFGWVSAKKVDFSVETNDNKPAALYAQPTRKSRKVGSVPIYADFAIVGYDCFGMKIRYKGIEGWLSEDDMCGNPLTTCP